MVGGDILKLLYDFDMLLPNRSLHGGGRQLTRALGTEAVGNVMTVVEQVMVSLI